MDMLDAMQISGGLTNVNWLMTGSGKCSGSSTTINHKFNANLDTLWDNLDYLSPTVNVAWVSLPFFPFHHIS